mmetsp:Transcript_6906/g.19076  ORF Transcript_6906/g.19076 Transcript_6906/m.19076 type:complete len:205 (+) Transcript_6906:2215-2829(+)
MDSLPGTVGAGDSVRRATRQRLDHHLVPNKLAAVRRFSPPRVAPTAVHSSCPHVRRVVIQKGLEYALVVDFVKFFAENEQPLEQLLVLLPRQQADNDINEPSLNAKVQALFILSADRRQNESGLCLGFNICRGLTVALVVLQVPDEVQVPTVLGQVILDLRVHVPGYNLGPNKDQGLSQIGSRRLKKLENVREDAYRKRQVDRP